jgi:hypothetical protein
MSLVQRSSPFSSPEAARIGGAIDIVTGRLQTAIDALIVVRPQLEKVVEGGVNLVRSRLTLARDAESSFGVALVKLTPVRLLFFQKKKVLFCGS